MDKVIKDGKVAVAVSGGHGSSWSYYAPDDIRAKLMFHPDIINDILHNDAQNCHDYDWVCKVIDDDDDDACIPAMGANGLNVHWVPLGVQFRINEYDGAESIEILNKDDWFCVTE